MGEGRVCVVGTLSASLLLTQTLYKKIRCLWSRHLSSKHLNAMMNLNFPRDFAEASSVHHTYPDMCKVGSKIISLRQFWAASITLFVRHKHKHPHPAKIWEVRRRDGRKIFSSNVYMSEERSNVYECQFRKPHPYPKLDPLFGIFPNAQPNPILKNPTSWALTVSKLFPQHDINISNKNFSGN